MTITIAYKTCSHQVHQEARCDKSGHTHTKETRTIETVNNGFVEPEADSYQEGKAYQRDNNTTIVGLLGGFILMSLVSLGASILFPVQRTQSNTSTSTLDITPAIIPMQSMGLY